MTTLDDLRAKVHGLRTPADLDEALRSIYRLGLEDGVAGGANLMSDSCSRGNSGFCYADDDAEGTIKKYGPAWVDETMRKIR